MSSYVAPPFLLGMAGEIDGELAALAIGCDLDVFTGWEAEQLFSHLAAISRRTDCLLGLTARRLAAGQAHRAAGRTDVINRCSAALGALPSEIGRMIDAAEQVSVLDQVALAARGGQLSGRELEMIAAAATNNPAAQERLLAAAGRGIQPLRDECLKVRREAETDGQQRTRMHRQRSYRSWTDDEGMYHGHLRVGPELGAEVKATIEAMARVVFRNRDAGEPPERPENYSADAVAALILRHATPTPPDGSVATESAECVVASHTGAAAGPGAAAGRAAGPGAGDSVPEPHNPVDEGEPDLRGDEGEPDHCGEPAATGSAAGREVERLRRLGNTAAASPAVNVIVDFETLPRRRTQLGGTM